MCLNTQYLFVFVDLNIEFGAKKAIYKTVVSATSGPHYSIWQVVQTKKLDLDLR